MNCPRGCGRTMLYEQCLACGFETSTPLPQFEYAAVNNVYEHTEVSKEAEQFHPALAIAAIERLKHVVPETV